MNQGPTISLRSKIQSGSYGFFLGAIPAFLLGLFVNDPFSTTCALTILMGFVCGSLSFLFGKRGMDFLVATLKHGFS